VRVLEQLVDAATSVGANLEEAAGGQSKADFVAKMCIARKEARESRYWLRVIITCFDPWRAPLSPLLQESTEILAIVAAIVRKASSNPRRG
jgi:four helix bundle protein